MRDETKAKRQAQIAAAAYALLEEKGFQGTSMLAIARRAKASNETLYNWYGDKAGLFEALVRGNATEMRGLLEAGLSDGQDPWTTLDQLGPHLLKVLTGPRAVALNRAAAADPTGTLGAALLRAGRENIAPLIARVMARLPEAARRTPEDMADLWLSLLLGDIQIRRVAGHMPEPDAATLSARANRARDNFRALLLA